MVTFEDHDEFTAPISVSKTSGHDTAIVAASQTNDVVHSIESECPEVSIKFELYSSPEETIRFEVSSSLTSCQGYPMTGPRTPLSRSVGSGSKSLAGSQLNSLDIASHTARAEQVHMFPSADKSIPSNPSPTSEECPHLIDCEATMTHIVGCSPEIQIAVDSRMSDLSKDTANSDGKLSSGITHNVSTRAQSASSAFTGQGEVIPLSESSNTHHSRPKTHQLFDHCKLRSFASRSPYSTPSMFLRNLRFQTSTTTTTSSLSQTASDDISMGPDSRFPDRRDARKEDYISRTSRTSERSAQSESTPPSSGSLQTKSVADSSSLNPEDLRHQKIMERRSYFRNYSDCMGLDKHQNDSRLQIFEARQFLQFAPRPNYHYDKSEAYRGDSSNSQSPPQSPIRPGAHGETIVQDSLFFDDGTNRTQETKDFLSTGKYTSPSTHVRLPDRPRTPRKEENSLFSCEDNGDRQCNRASKRGKSSPGHQIYIDQAKIEAGPYLLLEIEHLGFEQVICDQCMHVSIRELRLVKNRPAEEGRLNSEKIITGSKGNCRMENCISQIKNNDSEGIRRADSEGGHRDPIACVDNTGANEEVITVCMEHDFKSNNSPSMSDLPFLVNLGSSDRHKNPKGEGHCGKDSNSESVPGYTPVKSDDGCPECGSQGPLRVNRTPICGSRNDINVASVRFVPDIPKRRNADTHETEEERPFHAIAPLDGQGRHAMTRRMSASNHDSQEKRRLGRRICQTREGCCKPTNSGTNGYNPRCIYWTMRNMVSREVPPSHMTEEDLIRIRREVESSVELNKVDGADENIHATPSRAQWSDWKRLTAFGKTLKSFVQGEALEVDSAQR